MQTNLSVQTVQTNCGGEVGGGICKSRGEVGGGICKSVITYTFANPPSHLSPAVSLHGLHGEVGLHLIRCLQIDLVPSQYHVGKASKSPIYSIAISGGSYTVVMGLLDIFGIQAQVG